MVDKKAGKKAGKKPSNGLHDKKLFANWLMMKYKERIFQTDNPMNKFLEKNLHTNMSSYARDMTARHLKMGMWINSMNTVVTTFKLLDTSDINNSPIIFTFLYTTVDHETKSNTKHAFYCCGPSLLSMDGEYRKRFCRFKALHIIIDKYKNIWSLLEEYILLKIRKLPWNYYAEYFYPTSKQKVQEDMIISSINTNKLAIKFLIMAWFIGFYNRINNITMNHINKLYTATMHYEETAKADEKIYKKLLDTFGDKIHCFYNDIKFM